MGTWTDLTVAGYPLIYSKSAVIREAMTVFRETDRRVYERRLSDRNPLVWRDPDDDDDEKTEMAVEYSCQTCKVIDRLEVMGFSFRRVREDFESGRQYEVEKLTAWTEESDSDWLADDLEFFKSLTFEGYTDALSRIIAHGLRAAPFDDHLRYPVRQ